METAVAAVLLIVMLLVIIRLSSFAFTYIGFGMTKLDQSSQLRIAIEQLKDDIRGAGADVKISDHNRFLRIGRFAANDSGGPLYDEKGMPKYEGYDEYRFVPSSRAGGSGVLYRNNRVVLSDLNNAEFILNQEKIQDIPLVKIIITLEQSTRSGGAAKTILHLSPRHLASWVRDPFWASVSCDQRFKYQFGTEP